VASCELLTSMPTTAGHDDRRVTLDNTISVVDISVMFHLYSQTRHTPLRYQSTSYFITHALRTLLTIRYDTIYLRALKS